MCYFGKVVKVHNKKQNAKTKPGTGIVIHRFPAGIPRRADVEYIEGEIVEEFPALPVPEEIPAPDVFTRRRVRVNR